MKRKYLYALLLAVIVALFVVPVVYAQVENPPVQADIVEDAAKLIAFAVLITGFAKQQFKLQGGWVLLVGLGITMLLGFLPEIQAAFPPAAKIMELVKLFLTSAGVFDTVVNVGAKIATATIDKKRTLSTDGSSLLPEASK